jgi:NAD-dependent oxidoreductase involved in siderophore biosynthesis
MVSGKIVRVVKQLTAGTERYVVTLTDSQGAVVWSSPELGKDQAIDTLLEIGLPAHKVPGKFEEAESVARAAKASAAVLLDLEREA